MESTRAFLINEQRVLRDLPLEEAFQAPKEAGYIWIHIVSESPAKVCAGLFLPPLVQKVLGDLRSRTRADTLENGLLFTFRCLNSKKGNEQPNYISLRSWVTERLIVTVQRYTWGVTEHLFQQKNAIMPDKPLGLLANLLTSALEQLTNLIFELDQSIDNFEDLVNQKQYQNSEDQRLRLAETRRQLVIVRRYLVPQREAFLRLHLEQYPWVDDSLRGRFRELAGSLMRLLDDFDLAKDRVGILQETLLALTQQQINEKLYLFSIVTVIFLPLNFLTGLLGMNVAWIPGVQNHSAFWIVLCILGAMGLVEFFFLRKRGYL